ncbi:hypothetical protein HETIRDRAFT_473617 [Heterobasidion irregulare TC 32-1]|uniref:Major facilitator superfamily (MFS) profile domain-containing protein n=1 Tax=Heterobasidion irregulare (strain TC 32-1) TaxID=747525 RepID=W4KGF0_HETIT|nr:uncharacterized protein HETIRDRAFT_473617 [Heterobasidion irregulare TC 32-1]ETW84917.1 hypothetical protein HETIRDRAFT_473617 [Heterobasidion irregulare TC 32-1]
MPHPSTDADPHASAVSVSAYVSDKPALAARPPRSALKSVCLVAACTLANLINITNITTVSISLPSIGRDLDIPEANLQWLISAYSLSSGCLLLFFGRLADLHGRKKTWLLGFLCMAVFSIGCGFAHNEITIDVLRAFQGIGGAAVVPASLGILAHAFPPSRARSVAFATFSAGAPVGGAVGMIIGGVLTQLSKPAWRSNFYLMAGICALAMAAGALSIDADEPSTEPDRRVDWLGAFLVTAGLVLVIFVLSDGETAPQQWKTPYIIALLVLGVLCLAAFVAWQLFLERVLDGAHGAGRYAWAPPPLMRLSMWTRANGRFAVMQTIACVNWCSFMAWGFWVQLYYQNYVQLSPILTMVRMLPMFVTGVACNVVIALIIGRVDVMYIVVVGTLFTSFANVFFALIDPNAPYWAFGFPAAIFSVFGADFVFAAGTLFIAKVARPHEQSVAGALFQTMTQIGTAFGLTVSTIVFNRVLARQTARLDGGARFDPAAATAAAPREAQLRAYQAAEWTAFAFGILGMLLAFFLRGVGIVGHKGEKAHEPEPGLDSQGTVHEDARVRPSRRANAAKAAKAAKSAKGAKGAGLAAATGLEVEKPAGDGAHGEVEERERTLEPESGDETETEGEGGGEGAQEPVRERDRDRDRAQVVRVPEHAWEWDWQEAQARARGESPVMRAVSVEPMPLVR